MSLPGRIRAAALCAALSTLLIAGMVGAAVAHDGIGCGGVDRAACAPPVVALSTAPPTADGPTPRPTPTPAVPTVRRCDPADPEPCPTRQARPAVTTGASPTP